jgi:hypothetical protein
MHHLVPILIGVCILLGAPTAHAEDTKAKASEHFEKGVALFKNQDFTAALVEFEAAYEAQPHFAVRYNVAICLYKLKRYGDAADQIQRYLSEGGDRIPADKKKEIEEIYAELESLVGSLTVLSSVAGARVLVNGEPRDRIPMLFPLKLDVGEYEIEISAEGYESHVADIKLPGGEDVVIEVDLVKIGGKKKLPVSGFATTAALTVALAAAAGITGGIALKRSKDYKDSPYDEDWQDEQKSGRNLALTADILWGVTGAAALTTIILALFTDFEKDEAPDTALTIQPHLLEPGLTLGGTF